MDTRAEIFEKRFFKPVLVYEIAHKRMKLRCFLDQRVKLFVYLLGALFGRSQFLILLTGHCDH